jgi:hypothetical protein
MPKYIHRLCHPVLLFITCINMLALHAQSYTVFSIKGTAFRAHHIPIEPDDTLSAGDVIYLGKKSDFLIVLNPRGTYKIAFGNSPKSNSEWYSLFVKDHIPLFVEGHRLSSKGWINHQDFADYFKPLIAINPKVLLSDTMKIPLIDPSLPTIDGKNNCLFLQLANGSNIDNHVLTVHGDTLLLAQNDFFFKGKLYSESDGRLTFGLAEKYGVEMKIRTLADSIHPSFMARSELEKIVAAIKKTHPMASSIDNLQKIYTALYFCYGRPDAVMNLVDEMLKTQPSPPPPAIAPVATP